MNFAFSDDFLGLFTRRGPQEVRKNNVPKEANVKRQSRKDKKKNSVEEENNADAFEKRETVSEKCVENIESIPSIKCLQSTEKKTPEEYGVKSKKLSEAAKLPVQSKNTSDNIALDEVSSSSKSPESIKQSVSSTQPSLKTEQTEIQKTNVELQSHPCNDSITLNQLPTHCQQSGCTDSLAENDNCLVSKDKEETPKKFFDLKTVFTEQDANISTENSQPLTENVPLSIENNACLNENVISAKTVTPATGNDSVTTVANSFQTPDISFTISTLKIENGDHESLSTSNLKITATKKQNASSSVVLPQEPVQRKYQCSHCNKLFPFPSKLKAHERAHTDENPFQCRFCDKTFLGKSNLNSHERSHSDKKTCDKKQKLSDPCSKQHPNNVVKKGKQDAPVGEVISKEHVKKIDNFPAIKWEPSAENEKPVLNSKKLSEATKLPTESKSASRDQNIAKDKFTEFTPSPDSQGLVKQARNSTKQNISIEQREILKTETQVEPNSFPCLSCGTSISPNPHTHQNEIQTVESFCWDCQQSAESLTCPVINEGETSNQFFDLKNVFLDENPSNSIPTLTDNDAVLIGNIEFEINNGYLSTKNNLISTENDQLSTENDQLSAENDQHSAENDQLSTENDQLSAEKDQLSAEKDQPSAENDAAKYGSRSNENDAISSETDIPSTAKDLKITSVNDFQIKEKDFKITSVNNFQFKEKNFKITSANNFQIKEKDFKITSANNFQIKEKDFKITSANNFQIKEKDFKFITSDVDCNEENFAESGRKIYPTEKPLEEKNLGTSSTVTAKSQAKHKCSYCNKLFSHRSKLQEHSCTHKEGRPFQCRFCKKSFKYQSSLAKHEITHAGEKAVTSDIRGNSNKTQRGTLLLHSKTANNYPSKSFTCQFCEKSFPAKWHLENHTRTHTGEKPFECEICGKSFTRNRILKIHKNKVHTSSSVVKFTPENNAKINFSKINNKSLPKQNFNTLEKQVTKISPEKKRVNNKKCEISINKALSCPVCFTQFNRSWHLKVHMLSHSDKQPNVNTSATPPKEPVKRKHQCLFCNKSFAKNSQLKIHEHTHTGEKPYGCRYCEKSFSQKQVLVKHERTHTGEKPFVCDICGKSFTQSGSLRAHSKIIHEQMYDCSTCGKEFVSPDLLKDHQKEHYNNNQAKYHCSYCNKSFPNLSRLKIHQLSHTGEKPFACNICGLRVGTKSSLNRHLLAKHNKKINDADGLEISSDEEGSLNDAQKQEKSKQICNSGSKNDEAVSLNCSIPPRKSESRKKNASTVVIYRKKYNLWIENDVKQYQCISCKQEFQDVTVLQDHDCGYSKTFRCSLCSKSFAAKCHLESHIRVHTGEKPFKCETCGKSYSERCTLLVHEKTSHVSSSCNICGKEFATKYLLKEHGRSEHSGNQFACKQCGKEFKTVYLLKRHEKLHTVVNPFQEIGEVTSPANDLLQNVLAKPAEENPRGNGNKRKKPSKDRLVSPSKDSEKILDEKNNSKRKPAKRKLKSQPKHKSPKHKLKKYEYFNG